MKTLRITTCSIDGEIDLSVDGKSLCMPFRGDNMSANNVIDRVSDAYETGFFAGCKHIRELMEDAVSLETIQLEDKKHVLGKTESLTI